MAKTKGRAVSSVTYLDSNGLVLSNSAADRRLSVNSSARAAASAKARRTLYVVLGPSNGCSSVCATKKASAGGGAMVGALCIGSGSRVCTKNCYVKGMVFGPSKSGHCGLPSGNTGSTFVMGLSSRGRMLGIGHFNGGASRRVASLLFVPSAGRCHLFVLAGFGRTGRCNAVCGAAGLALSKAGAFPLRTVKSNGGIILTSCTRVQVFAGRIVPTRRKISCRGYICRQKKTQGIACRLLSNSLPSNVRFSSRKSLSNAPSRDNSFPLTVQNASRLKSDSSSTYVLRMRSGKKMN